MTDGPAGTWFDGEPEPYSPDLYPDRVDPGGLDGFESVTPAAVECFHSQGYLVLRRAFSADEVARTLEAFLDLIGGKDPDFRGIQFEAGARALLPSLPPDRKQDAVRKFWRFVEHDARLRALAEQPALLETLGLLLGDAPEMFQDMALFKPPGVGREKPWHQDCAYFNLPAGTTVVGAWIALDAATVENGCMRVIPGSHRRGPAVHFHRRDWQICDTDVRRDAAVAIPLEPGGCLLFHGLLQHGTPANRSPRRRRAVQFHYKPAAVPWGDPGERLARFGSEGKDVTC